MAKQRPYPGLLIAVEGPAEAGRRAALAHARAALVARGREVLVTWPMGDSVAGDILRQAAPLREPSAGILALLGAADLAERLEWEIWPALAAGKVVVAERYVDRIVRGLEHGLDSTWLEALGAFAPGPDLMLLCDSEWFGLAPDLEPTSLQKCAGAAELASGDEVAATYRRWADGHEVALVEPRSPSQISEEIAKLLGPESPACGARSHAVTQLMLCNHHDLPHALQVARLAGQLFDQLEPLHGLGPSAAELLEYGLLLHTAGERSGREWDDGDATAWIRDSGLEGFASPELHAISVLAAAHRMRHNRELEARLTTVPSEYRDAVRKLAPIAGLAEGMDASRRQLVRWIEASLRPERKLLVQLQSRTKAAEELRAARERAQLLQRTYMLEVEVQARRQGPPPGAGYPAELGAHQGEATTLDLT